MQELKTFYIGGAWVAPAPGHAQADVVNPATEAVTGTVAMGGAQDVDRAVAAARAAFPVWSRTSRAERLALLRRMAELYQARAGEIAEAISTEIGAPLWLCREYQVPMGLAQIQTAIAALESFDFVTASGTTQVVREPVGVAALITPWNWPVNQIAAKVAPALAAGCTVVLKPSEIAPLDARIFAEIVHDAGAPRAYSTCCSAPGPRSGQRWRGMPAWTWCRSPARPARGWMSRSRLPPPSSAWRRNWAASRPT